MSRIRILFVFFVLFLSWPFHSVLPAEPSAAGEPGPTDLYETYGVPRYLSVRNLPRIRPVELFSREDGKRNYVFRVETQKFAFTEEELLTTKDLVNGIPKKKAPDNKHLFKLPDHVLVKLNDAIVDRRYTEVLEDKKHHELVLLIKIPKSVIQKTSSVAVTVVIDEDSDQFKLYQQLLLNQFTALGKVIKELEGKNEKDRNFFEKELRDWKLVAKLSEELDKREARLEDFTPQNLSLDSIKTATFEFIDVQLNLLPEDWVGLTYGKKTAESFYVAKIRIKNDVDRDEEGERPKPKRSMLAYSSAIEAMVALEKRYNSWLNSVIDLGVLSQGDKWQPVLASDFDISPQFQPLYRTPTGETNISVPENKSAALRYRPLTYDMVISSFDGLDKQTWESQFLSFLDLTITIAGGAAALVTARDYGTVMSFVGGPIRGGLQTWLKSLTESQRLNLIRDSFKPIEEIPPAGYMEKVMFFPKGEIQGMIRGHNVRVSQIFTNYIKVEVALITKELRTGESR